MASAGAGLIIEPNATGRTGGGAERDPFASPDRKKPKSDAPPSARSTGTTGTRYSDAVSVRLNFKPSPSRPGEPPPSYTIKYAAPEVLRNGGFQSKSVEKKAMEEADNKLAMLLFDTDFQKKLGKGNAEAKAYLENLERLKRGKFKNGNFPKVKPLEPKEFLDIPPVGPPPPLAPLRIKKFSPPSPIKEEEEKPETRPKTRKSRKTRKSKKSRKTRKSRTRKH